jgi:hypothetical protein
VAWRSFLWARGSGCRSFDSPWCCISSKCGSSISERFLIRGAHTVCFCLLVTVLDLTIVSLCLSQYFNCNFLIQMVSPLQIIANKINISFRNYFSWLLAFSGLYSLAFCSCPAIVFKRDKTLNFIVSNSFILLLTLPFFVLLLDYFLYFSFFFNYISLICNIRHYVLFDFNWIALKLV